jgi:competence protein ComEA
VRNLIAEHVGSRFDLLMDPIKVDGGWRERIEILAGRRVHALAVGLLIVLVTGVAVVMWVARSAPRIAPPSEALPPALPAPTTSGGSVLVHVAGAVREPGVYTLPTGARVIDAIESAGDARPSGDLNALNLASAVTDGMQVLVPRRAGASTSTVPTTSASPSPAPVNVNTADGPALETIPGIGPVTATAIIEYRDQSGAFSSVEQLIDVSGIGPATLETIRPYITV